MPFSMKTTSGFGAKTQPFPHQLVVAIVDLERTDVPSILQRIRQHISFAVQRATAEGFLMREET